MRTTETNKIVMAILIAGLSVMLTGFFSKKLFHSEHMEENAYPIDTGIVASASHDTGPTGPEPILALLADADVAKGEKISKACAACHSFEQGGPNKIGPNLWDIVGHDVAAKGDFSYSAAFQSIEGVWGYQNLNELLYKPKEFAPGTKMNYIGLKKPEDRAAVIAWLRTLSPSPQPLPSAEEISLEIPEDEEFVEPPVMVPEEDTLDESAEPASEEQAGEAEQGGEEETTNETLEEEETE